MNKTINYIKGICNAIIDPKFWQDNRGAEWFVDDLDTGKYYFLRCVDGDNFYKVPGGNGYSTYITAYAALEVWAKSRNMTGTSLYKDEGGEEDGRTQEVGRTCRAFGQQFDSAGNVAPYNIYARSTVH